MPPIHSQPALVAGDHGCSSLGVIRLWVLTRQVQGLWDSTCLKAPRVPVLWPHASHLESQGYEFIVKVIEVQSLFPKAHSKTPLWEPIPSLQSSPAGKHTGDRKTPTHPPHHPVHPHLLSDFSVLFPPGSQKIRASSNVSVYLPRAGHALKRATGYLCSEEA